MTPNAVAYAYLRKSVAGRQEMDKQQDLQRAAVAAIAERNGLTLGRILDGDWGRSAGRSGRHKRSAMADLIEAVRSGAVAAVIAYALDRLARDTEYALTLWHACADQGVPIIVDGARYDTASSEDRMRFVLTMEMAAGELDRITKRNRDVKVRAAATGGNLGGKLRYGHDPRKPDESVEAVIAAYRETGTYLGACVILNRTGVPSARGGTWTARSVWIIVDREAHELTRPLIRRERVAAKRTHLFSGLLRCPYDGSTLMAFSRPGRKRKDGTIGPGSNAYLCRTAHLTGSHRPLLVAEASKVLPAVQALVADWRAIVAKPGAPQTAPSDVTAGARRKIGAALKRAAERGAFAELASLTAQLAEVERQAGQHVEVAEARGVLIGGGLDLDWSRPAEANYALRLLFSYIRLDRSLIPVEVIE